ncbi:MAG TPA: SH3 domain-containing protein, partial [Chloroflexi bacterium]|nr:SH3 domain-containing protein [Chloroflexota bacterium]
MPSPTTEPTPSPTETPATIVAGGDGVNVRQGPGTNFTRLGYLEPGTQAKLIGKYNDWWQIEYNGAPAWVFGNLVTASNAENVPQV